MQDLIDKTHAVHYELYRRTKLEDMGFSDGGGDKQSHSLQETYELRRQEYMKNIQGREEQMRQSFVNKVKEKEAELKQAEQEVKCLWKCYLFGKSKKKNWKNLDCDRSTITVSSSWEIQIQFFCYASDSTERRRKDQ